MGLYFCNSRVRRSAQYKVTAKVTTAEEPGYTIFIRERLSPIQDSQTRPLIACCGLLRGLKTPVARRSIGAILRRDRR
jgi:hypothetical protein